MCLKFLLIETMSMKRKIMKGLLIVLFAGLYKLLGLSQEYEIIRFSPDIELIKISDYAYTDSKIPRQYYIQI